MYATYKAVGVIGDEELLTFRENGSRLEGHPTPRKLPWVETATGSLGQGLPVGVGIALAGKRLDHTDHRVWVLCGDSEARRGLRVGGGRAGRVREPGQPHRDRGRQPAGPARPHPARPRPRRLRPPLPGVRLAHRGGGRARRGRRGPRLRRGAVHPGPADRDPRPHPQGQGRGVRAGPGGAARQAAAGGGGRDRRTGRPPRPAHHRPRAARRLPRPPPPGSPRPSCPAGSAARTWPPATPSARRWPRSATRATTWWPWTARSATPPAWSTSPRSTPSATSSATSPSSR